ncbi:MAG: DUF4372 domain-containing protein, partial [Terriglobales bacterium]
MARDGAQIVTVEFVAARAPEAELNCGHDAWDFAAPEGGEDFADQGSAEAVGERTIIFFMAARMVERRGLGECRECSPLRARLSGFDRTLFAFARNATTDSRSSGAATGPGYRRGRKSRSFAPWSHVVSLLYAQLTHALGLHDVCDALRRHSGPLSAIRGATPPSKNGLSTANRERPAQRAQDRCWAVLEHLQQLHSGFGGRRRPQFAFRFKRAIHLA